MNHLCALMAMTGIDFCDKTPAHSPALIAKFNDHMSTFGLSYGTKDEFNFRLDQFAKTDKRIAEVNAKHTSFWLAHNKFSTWTDAEYKTLFFSEAPKGEPEAPAATPDEPDSKPLLDDDNLDWRDSGAVNPVEDAGGCKAAWAFSAVSVAEGHHQIKSGELLHLSRQQVLDCVTTSYGCQGGWPYGGLDYMTKGVELASDYPFTGQDEKCKAKKGSFKVETVDPVKVEERSRDRLLEAITHGPVSVFVSAYNEYWKSYSGGIFDSQDCPNAVDHVVTAVGYGTDDRDRQFYILKNVWGVSWGEEGYIRLLASNVDMGLGICGTGQRSPVWASTTN